MLRRQKIFAFFQSMVDGMENHGIGSWANKTLTCGTVGRIKLTL